MTAPNEVEEILLIIKQIDNYLQRKENSPTSEVFTYWNKLKQHISLLLEEAGYFDLGIIGE